MIIELRGEEYFEIIQKNPDNINFESINRFIKSIDKIREDHALDVERGKFDMPIPIEAYNYKGDPWA